jgi:hypothetical protein
MFQRFNKSDYRKAVEAHVGGSFNKKVLQCIAAIGSANVLIFARSRTLDTQSLEDLAAVISTEREIMLEVLGVGDTPNAHTGKHFPMFADLHTLLRLIWTNRGEAKHLQFKLMVKGMNKWNIETDMLLFDDLQQVKEEAFLIYHLPALTPALTTLMLPARITFLLSRSPRNLSASLSVLVSFLLSAPSCFHLLPAVV